MGKVSREDCCLFLCCLNPTLAMSSYHGQYISHTFFVLLIFSMTVRPSFPLGLLCLGLGPRRASRGEGTRRYRRHRDAGVERFTRRGRC